MAIIHLENNTTDDLIENLIQVLDIKSQVYNLPTDEEIILDGRQLLFVHPFLILPLTALIDSNTPERFEFLWPHNHQLKTYLNTIRFFNKQEKFDSFRYEGKSYLPIVHFPTGIDRMSNIHRQNIVNSIFDIIDKKIRINKSNYRSGVKYLISELTDNIVDHSKQEKGWCLVQYYPNKRFMEICIVDNGITILGSYKRKGHSEIINDEMAIGKAISGVSTKDNLRGFGINTSLRMTTEGMNGTFILVSGKGILHAKGNRVALTQMPSSWDGTIVALRIKKNIKNFEYVNFLE